MSPMSSPRELAELTLRRLNRAAADLGLTLRGRDLFTMDMVNIDGIGEVFDIVLNVAEFEQYADLATALELLARKVTDAGLVQRLDLPMPARAFHQPALPGFE